MKNMGKGFGILLFVFAGFLLIYTIWALTHNINYISYLINSGQLQFAGSEFDIISFYMTSSVQYAVYAMVLIALGWMMARKPDTIAISGTPPEEEQEKSEEDLDEWFNEPNGETKMKEAED